MTEMKLVCSYYKANKTYGTFFVESKKIDVILIIHFFVCFLKFFVVFFCDDNASKNLPVCHICVGCT